MTIFKQIIGRGSRIDEDFNKYFFTIMDFKKATELFKDPDFDGEPVVIYEPDDGDRPTPPDPIYDDDDFPDDDSDDDGGSGNKKVYVSGVPAKIKNETIEYLGSDGKLVTESYKDFSKKKVTEEYASLDDFLIYRSKSEKKRLIIDLLEDHGVILENLAEIVGKEYGDFDLICHIAYGQPPLTRKERANKCEKA